MRDAIYRSGTRNHCVATGERSDTETVMRRSEGAVGKVFIHESNLPAAYPTHAGIVWERWITGIPTAETVGVVKRVVAYN
jgi:hypothetical protein